MTPTLKNIRELFFYLLPVVLFSSVNLFETVATASIEKDSVYDNDFPKLRGEIWYGTASWYGKKFHGKKTSNGEKYNKNDLTAAHRYLPFNTKVKVTNLQNKKSIVVRINDRGPFVEDRIIDLSEEAAERIDLRNKGISYIKLQIVTPISGQDIN